MNTIEQKNIEQKNIELSDILQLVSFKIDDEEFGVNILKVQEINKMIQITKMPNSPKFVEGVINLRGRVLPVIDLRTKLGIPKKEQDKNTRIIVVEVNDRIVGFIVDSVSEVLRIPSSITEAPPSMVAGIDKKYITAIGKLDDRLLILLDLEKTLLDHEKMQLDALNN